MTAPVTTRIAPAELRRRIHDGGEIAVVDPREIGDFTEKSLFFAVPLPLSRLELRAADLLPRRDVRIVVVDRAGEIAPRAAGRLSELGYRDVAILDGGIAAWEAAGFPAYSGYHVPSKAFAEVVEEELHTPWIEASELDQRLRAGENLVVFDGRSFAEYKTNTIPQAVSVPNAELVRHARDLVPNAETLVVVNCGGRTRSIIGAQALINAGLPNRVVSLKNGTMAWHLAGLAVEKGADRRPAPVPSPTARQWGEAAAADIAATHDVQSIDRLELARWRRDPARTLYVLDVRTPEEYEASHLPGSIQAPGGQLVQETDAFVAVRGARVVLVDDAGLVRARVTAHWLQQLGLSDVVVLEGGLGDDALEVGAYRPPVLGLQPLAAVPPPVVTPDALAALLAAGTAIVVDLAPSPTHKRGHIPGAAFAIRSRLAARLDQLPGSRTVVLTSEDGVLAQLAAHELRLATGLDARVLAGGTAAWRAAGQPLETGIAQAIDVIDDAWLPARERDSGIEEAMHAYLDWEIGLAHQVASDPDVRFALKLPAARQPVAAA